MIGAFSYCDDVSLARKSKKKPEERKEEKMGLEIG